MSNISKMNELISQTEELITTLTSLNNEVESYKVAKNNLIDVKEKLSQFVDGAFEANASISSYIKELHMLVNSEIVDKIDLIVSNTALIKSTLEITQQNSQALEKQNKALLQQEISILRNYKLIRLLVITSGASVLIMLVILLMIII